MTLEQTVVLWRGITFLGDWHFVVVLACIVLIVLMRQKRKHEAWVFGVTLFITECVTYGSKLLFQHPRPLDALVPADDPYSFPSGHSVIAVAFYGMLATLFLRRFSRNPVARVAVVSVTGALIMLIGASRVILGVHYPEDVLFGYSLGALSWLIFFLKTANSGKKRN